MWFTNRTDTQPWTKGKVLFVSLAVRFTLVMYSNIHDYMFNVLFVSLAVRFTLVMYSNIHDYMFNVNFTDIDYHVFSDAAHHVYEGRSPFERATYRYTPVLAWMLVPNEKWRDFGKFLFCFFDIFVGYLCFEIISNSRTTSAVTEKKEDEPDLAEEEVHPSMFPVVFFWLANPLTAIISARGNADCLVCAAVLLTLYLLQKDKWLLAAIVHGALAVHLKIYPLIYFPSIFIYLSKMSESNGAIAKIKSLIFNPRGFAFVLISLFAFVSVVSFLYLIYGDQFLDEFLFYHVRRRDIRHNFSIYYLPLYLVQNNEWLSKLIGFVAFVPQLISVAYFALRFSYDLPFCWLLSTFMFVSFNKVCTSQYFIWYIVFLPLVAANLEMSRFDSLRLIGTWFGAQGLWLLFAYLFEFQGMAVFEMIWLSSLVFLVANCYICRCLIQSYRPSFKIKSN